MSDDTPNLNLDKLYEQLTSWSNSSVEEASDGLIMYMSDQFIDQCRNDTLHYIGIDNGLKGAVACVGPLGHLLWWFPMPVKDGEVDVRALKCKESCYSTFNPIHTGGCKILMEQPIGAKSYRAAVSMAASFHAVRGVLEPRYDFSRITAFTWQKAMLPGYKKGADTKAMALKLARELWPDEKWLATPRSKVPHDGAVDAAIISEYLRRKDQKILD